MEFTGFKPEHVSYIVTDIINGKKGTIVNFDGEAKYPVEVLNKSNESLYYSTTGQSLNSDKFRRLYFGEGLKVEVAGEEVPEPKLICPVCGVEHKINLSACRGFYYFDDVGGECPFEFSRFEYEGHIKDAMRKLISIMEKE